jgi:hypothetical protein
LLSGQKLSQPFFASRVEKICRLSQCVRILTLFLSWSGNGSSTGTRNKKNQTVSHHEPIQEVISKPCRNRT